MLDGSFRRILVFCAVLAAPGSFAWGATYSSTQTGSWTSTATWGGGGWPQNASDTATVNAGHTVTVDVNIPAIASVTVGGSGILRLYGSGAVGDTRTVTQAVSLAHGAGLYSQRPYGYSPSDVHILHGSLTLNPGTANIRTDYANLAIYSTISGDGGLNVAGLLSDNNQRAVFLYGNNTFTGEVTLGSSATVYVGHSNALGAASGKRVRVAASSNWGALHLLNAAGGLGNSGTEVAIGGNLNTFYQGHTTRIDSRFRMEGGTYAFREGTWAVPGYSRTNAGEIVLSTGTTNVIARGGGVSGGSPLGQWWQQGSISGEGSLVVSGGDGWAATVFFTGSNSYSGGTRLDSLGSGHENRMFVGSDMALGTGPVEINGVPGYPNALGLIANCTLVNAFRGRGNIRTDSYRLTVTGSVAPNDSGMGPNATKQIGVLNVEDLNFGSTDKGCAYHWQYDETTNDVLVCATLQFGTGLNTLNAEWLGAGSAPLGEYVLMTYGGVDPTAGAWRVNHSAGHKGRVWVDGDNNRVMARFWRAGTVVLFR